MSSSSTNNFTIDMLCNKVKTLYPWISVCVFGKSSRRVAGNVSIAP